MTKRTRPVFRWPVALAASTVVGLSAALVGGPPWAALSWIALGLPVGAIVMLCWRGLRSGRDADA